MTEVTPKERLAGKPLKEDSFTDMLMTNFEKLPDTEKALYRYASFYLAANGAVVGLIADFLYGRALNVQRSFSVILAMTGMPVITTYTAYNAALTTPLMFGDIDCHSCATLRGATVGALCGAVYPIFLAFPLNFGLAARYNTAPIPEKGNLLRHWLDVSLPIWRRMRSAVLLQAVFGAYLGSRDFGTYTKVLELTERGGTEALE
ncbi:transmembrane protein 126A [Neosynchiropus ocellatus]